SLNRIWRSSSFRLAILFSLILWLANTAVVLALYNFTLGTLVHEVADRLDHDVEKRLAKWPRELPHQTGVSQWLYRQLALQIATMDNCAALIDSDGETQISNIDEQTSSN